MSRFTVVFDACVLYPAPLRDALMRLALTGLFKAHWTEEIHQEWIQAVCRNNPKLNPELIDRTRQLMNTHVGDAVVTGYEPLIESLSLPDPNDRHVLAAAIHSNASAIVTHNLKDFPEDALSPHGIEALHPDEFIYLQIEISSSSCLTAFKNQRLALKNPPLAVDEFLRTLRQQQLPKTVSFLQQHTELI